MSDAREKAQEWLKFHDLQIDDLHQLVGDLLTALTTAERERDEAIAECDRYKMALKKYGNCLGNCWTERAFDAPCDCGFGEALKGGGE